MRVKI